VVAEVAVAPDARAGQHMGEGPDARTIADVGALAKPLRVNEKRHDTIFLADIVRIVLVRPRDVLMARPLRHRTAAWT